LKRLDSRLRGNDKKERFETFHEYISIGVTGNSIHGKVCGISGVVASLHS